VKSLEKELADLEEKSAALTARWSAHARTKYLLVPLPHRVCDFLTERRCCWKAARVASSRKSCKILL